VIGSLGTSEELRILSEMHATAVRRLTLNS
jgi:hypothetical protein